MEKEINKDQYLLHDHELEKKGRFMLDKAWSEYPKRSCHISCLKRSFSTEAQLKDFEQTKLLPSEMQEEKKQILTGHDEMEEEGEKTVTAKKLSDEEEEEEIMKYMMKGDVWLITAMFAHCYMSWIKPSKSMTRQQYKEFLEKKTFDQLKQYYTSTFGDQLTQVVQLVWKISKITICLGKTL